MHTALRDLPSATSPHRPQAPRPTSFTPTTYPLHSRLVTVFIQFAFSYAVPWSFCSVSPYSTLRLLSTPSLGRCPDGDALPSSPYLGHHSFRPSLSTSCKTHSIWALFKSCYHCLFICPPCFYFSRPRNVGQPNLESTLRFLVPFCPFSYPPFYLVPKNHNFHFSPTRSPHAESNHKCPLLESHITSHDEEAIFYFPAVYSERKGLSSICHISLPCLSQALGYTCTLERNGLVTFFPTPAL